MANAVRPVTFDLEQTKQAVIRSCKRVVKVTEPCCASAIAIGLTKAGVPPSLVIPCAAGTAKAIGEVSLSSSRGSVNSSTRTEDSSCTKVARRIFK